MTEEACIKEINSALKTVKKELGKQGIETPEDYLKARILSNNFTQNGMNVERVEKKEGRFDVYVIPEENGLIKRIVYMCNDPDLFGEQE